MRHSQRLLVITAPLFLSVVLSTLPAARGGDRAAEELFRKIALKQRQGLRDLQTIRRGRKLEPGGRVNCSTVAEVTRPYSRLGYWPGTGVLVYDHEGSKLHAWLIGARGLLGFSSTEVTRRDLDRLVEEQRVALGVQKLQSSRAPGLRGLRRIDELPRRNLDDTTRELTKLLIPPPIATALTEIKHLIIVPVHSIGVVPFAMLRPLSDKDDVLIDRMSISVAPSLFDLDQLLNETFPPPELEEAKYTFETPLIVGLSEFRNEGKYRFPPLPGVKEELQAVAKELDVRPLLNSQATKRSVQARTPDADLIYIASHGFADEKEGYLVLWPEAESDGIWSGQEIHDVRFEKAYVAVLSACQTGLGRIHDAGMIGVARSFQMGGVPRVVVSLWSVKDKETALFMVKLVRNMRKTMVAEALRQTALEMRREYPDPLVWASFSLFGTPR